MRVYRLRSGMCTSIRTLTEVTPTARWRRCRFACLRRACSACAAATRVLASLPPLAADGPVVGTRSSCSTDSTSGAPSMSTSILFLGATFIRHSRLYCSLRHRCIRSAVGPDSSAATDRPPCIWRLNHARSDRGGRSMSPCLLHPLKRSLRKPVASSSVSSLAVHSHSSVIAARITTPIRARSSVLDSSRERATKLSTSAAVPPRVAASAVTAFCFCFCARPRRRSSCTFTSCSVLAAISLAKQPPHSAIAARRPLASRSTIDHAGRCPSIPRTPDRIMSCSFWVYSALSLPVVWCSLLSHPSAACHWSRLYTDSSSVEVPLLVLLPSSLQLCILSL